jgi:probable LLM family oxidoreductase
MELGITTFAETTPDPSTGATVSHGERLRQVLEEVEAAEQAGLDVYGVGEHHRADFAASSPATLLAAAAARTSTIKLTSAVTVLSSDDPVRVYQQFATVDAISGGRAEIIAGRGSFTESFPLFGYDLKDYDDLFVEKLGLLLKIRKSERVTWSGRFRAPLRDEPVYPRAVGELPIWIGVGGNPESVIRAGLLGLPLALAIIGGSPAQFAPLADLYRRALAEGKQEPQPISVHAHGYLADSAEQAAADFFAPYKQAMDVIGRERGWMPMTKGRFEQLRSPQGALLVGNPEQVAVKIIGMRETLGIERFLLHISVGTLPHDKVLRAIELLGKEVAPIVRESAR